MAEGKVKVMAARLLVTRPTTAGKVMTARAVGDNTNNGWQRQRVLLTTPTTARWIVGDNTNNGKGREAH